MSHPIELDRDDDVVRELLAPFARVQPVSLRRRTPAHSSRPRLVAVAAATVVILVFVGLAAAGAFGPLHSASISPSPLRLGSAVDTRLACSLIGKTAGEAEASLQQQGYQIEWRFQHWGTQTLQSPDKNRPGAVSGGYATTPASVPAGSVVWDIDTDTRSPKTLLVFVQAANDPNAPTIIPPSCPAG